MCIDPGFKDTRDISAAYFPIVPPIRVKLSSHFASVLHRGGSHAIDNNQSNAIIGSHFSGQNGLYNLRFFILYFQCVYSFVFLFSSRLLFEMAFPICLIFVISKFFRLNQA